MTVPAPVLDCSICPRLCRDVCPVAVHGLRDQFIPNEKMRAVAAVLGHPAGVADTMRLLACTDCGACSEYCLYSIPVASWLDEAINQLDGLVATPPPVDPPAACLDVDEVGDAVMMLATCRESEGLARERTRRHAPRGNADSPLSATRSQWPAGLDKSEFSVVNPALGSGCCGQRLSPDVGDHDLRDRMAQGMLATVPDDATVCVHNVLCAGHLQRVAGGRVHVVTVARGDATSRHAPAQEQTETGQTEQVESQPVEGPTP